MFSYLWTYLVQPFQGIDLSLLGLRDPKYLERGPVSYIEFYPDFLFPMLPFTGLSETIDASVSGSSGFLLCESDTPPCLLTSCRLAAGFQLFLLCWVSDHLSICFPSSKMFLTFLVSSVALWVFPLILFWGFSRRVKINSWFTFLMLNWKSWYIFFFISFFHNFYAIYVIISLINSI